MFLISFIFLSSVLLVVQNFWKKKLVLYHLYIHYHFYSPLSSDVLIFLPFFQSLRSLLWFLLSKLCIFTLVSHLLLPPFALDFSLFFGWLALLFGVWYWMLNLVVAHNSSLTRAVLCFSNPGKALWHLLPSLWKLYDPLISYHPLCFFLYYLLVNLHYTRKSVSPKLLSSYIYILIFSFHFFLRFLFIPSRASHYLSESVLLPCLAFTLANISWPANTRPPLHYENNTLK